MRQILKFSYLKKSFFLFCHHILNSFVHLFLSVLCIKCTFQQRIKDLNNERVIMERLKLSLDQKLECFRLQ